MFEQLYALLKPVRKEILLLIIKEEIDSGKQLAVSVTGHNNTSETKFSENKKLFKLTGLIPQEFTEIKASPRHNSS